MEQAIKRLYLNTHIPGSFSGQSGFRKNHPKYYASTVQKVLKTTPAYTLHHPVRKNFPRRRIYASYPGEIFAIDLVDISKFKKTNNQYSYLLTSIDVFSKQAFVEPLKDKSSKSVCTAFKKILKRVPFQVIKIHSDQGREFFNSDFQKLLSDNHAMLYYTQSDKKSAVVERFNRTLMDKVYRYMTHKNNTRFVSELQNIVSQYNNSFHRSIKMKPKEVNMQNRAQVYINLFGSDFMKSDSRKELYELDDPVLISRIKTTFQKGREQTFGSEVFRIHRIKNTNPRTYILRDLNNEIITGGFYREELQKVSLK